MKDLRKVLVLENGTWRSANMIDIRRSNVFKLFQPDETPVIFKGKNEFIAIENAFYNDDNIAAVPIDMANL
jgi:hypothetical protein